MIDHISDKDLSKDYLKKLKEKLKLHYVKEFNDLEKAPTAKELDKLRIDNKYCRKVVELRKRLSTQQKIKRQFMSPVRAASKLSSKINRTALGRRLVHAPNPKRLKRFQWCDLKKVDSKRKATTYDVKVLEGPNAKRHKSLYTVSTLCLQNAVKVGKCLRTNPDANTYDSTTTPKKSLVFARTTVIHKATIGHNISIQTGTNRTRQPDVTNSPKKLNGQ